MRRYLSYRRYRRGANRCLQCGMKLNDRKHHGGNHEHIFADMLKWAYSKPLIKLFKKEAFVYDALPKTRGTDEGKGYEFNLRYGR